MTIPIEFRALTIDTKKMVFGFYLKSGKNHHSSIKHLIAVDEGSSVRYAGLDFYEVIPETIGQFIGLLDKNGNKIFEGDVLESFVENEVLKGTVFYAADLGGYIYGSIEDFTELGICYRLSDEIEVIGNIHQNPQILL